MHSCVVLLPFAIAVSACTQIPRTSEQGKIEIQKVSDTVACELAAVSTAFADAPRFSEVPFVKWQSKSSLDLMRVDTAGLDGNGVWSIAYGGGPMSVTPSLAVSRKDSSTAHLDFATSIKNATTKYQRECKPGDDPSGTGLGLAAWITSTLRAPDEKITTHGGMSFTREFEVRLAPGTRFGYTARLIDLDIGGGVSRTGTHRLTVALAPPPPKDEPTRVIIVGEDRKLMGVLPSAAPRAPGANNNPTLNRLLLQRAPVRIEGDVLR